MTVREAFSLAFGPVPEGATCHEGKGTFGPIPVLKYKRGMVVRWLFVHFDWEQSPNLEIGPDISERLASEFLGFFGEAYDKVVQGG